MALNVTAEPRRTPRVVSPEFNQPRDGFNGRAAFRDGIGAAVNGFASGKPRCETASGVQWCGPPYPLNPDAYPQGRALHDGIMRTIIPFQPQSYLLVTPAGVAQ